MPAGVPLTASQTLRQRAEQGTSTGPADICDGNSELQAGGWQISEIHGCVNFSRTHRDCWRSSDAGICTAQRKTTLSTRLRWAVCHHYASRESRDNGEQPPLPASLTTQPHQRHA